LGREAEMIDKEVGFIGGGRATRIILGGLKRARRMPLHVVVSDSDEGVLRGLKNDFPEISTAPGDNGAAASARDLVFISLHPPVFRDAAGEIRAAIRPGSTIVSFMATVKIEEIEDLLGGHQRVLRTSPNAPSIVNAGYNPVAFGAGFGDEEKRAVLDLMGLLGQCPVVEEEKLESYAIITAMGPTYLWFQLHELEGLAVEFGFGAGEAADAVAAMAEGAAKTMKESGLTPEEVMDLVPVKPLGDVEDEIREMYRTRLRALYKRLRG
jgi:pyrroline-5-carboxylate reductase